MKTKDTMQEFLQKQPYRMTIARHKLGIHQCRIMVRIVEQLQPYMSMKVDHTKRVDDIWVRIKVSELVVQNNVKPLREALNSLKMKKECIMHFIEEEAAFLEIGTSLIKEYKYKHGEQNVEIQISGHLLPKITSIASGYTKYSVKIAFETSSPNNFKLYQYIAHFRDKKQIELKVKTLREWLQLNNKYAMPAEIKKKILNPAMQELKEKADVWFDISKRITEGRKMVGWVFNIYTKKGYDKIPKASILSEKNKPEPQPVTNRYAPVTYGATMANIPHEQSTATKPDLKTRLSKDFKLSNWQVDLIMEKVSKKEINKTLHDINDIKTKKPIKNIGGLTWSMFVNILEKL